MPEEDFHLSDHTRFQAHWNARSRARWFRRAPERPRHPLSRAAASYPLHASVLTAALRHWLRRLEAPVVQVVGPRSRFYHFEGGPIVGMGKGLDDWIFY